MNIRQKLEIIKENLGLTQTELAEKLGVSFVAFNNWWNEKSTPRAKSREAINRLLLEVTGQKSIPANQLSAKKEALVKRSQKYASIISEILTNPDVRDEFILALTYHSNRIEGSTLTESETAAILFNNTALPNRTLTEQLEVKNHQTALLYLFDWMNNRRQISQELVLKLHGMLMNGVHPEAGQYRRQAVRIVGTNLPTANYLKIPELMPKIMADVRKKTSDIISRAADIHSRFEQVHPFADGNGRVGRLLMNAMLLKENLPPAVIRQENKRLYYNFLYQAQTKADSSSLENFLCDAVLDGFKILERINLN